MKNKFLLLTFAVFIFLANLQLFAQSKFQSKEFVLNKTIEKNAENVINLNPKGIDFLNQISINEDIKYTKSGLNQLLGNSKTSFYSKINDQNESVFPDRNTSNFTAASSCTPDTLKYAQAKATGFSFISINSATSGQAVAQYFDCPQDITVNGLTFYAYKMDVNGGITLNATAEIYLAGPDSLPLGSPLATTIVPVDTAFHNGNLPLLAKHATFTPVTLSQPYVVVVSNTSAINMAMIFNSWTSSDGLSEWLTSVDIGGNWYRSYQINVGGYILNSDILIEPHVSYTLTSDFIQSPTCLSSTGTATWINNSSPVFFNRMYSQAVFAGIPEYQFYWNFGDASTPGYAVDTTHSYLGFGPWNVTLSDTLFGWTRNCSDQIIKSTKPASAHCDCGDLFFSEYIEGSSSNKALEIYNPTNNIIDLSDYVIYRFNNGSPSATDSLFPQGLITGGDVFVVGNPSANSGILTESDTTHTITFYNGDDALVLIRISSGDTLDVIGKIGEDPGVGWIVGTGSTSNFTLIRQKTINRGSINWNIGATQWDVYSIDMLDSLGFHTMNPANFGPESGFSYMDTDLTVIFTDTSLYAPTNWSWDFGDGNTSTMQNPTHAYSSPGNYTVCLIASNDCGADTLCKSIIVNCSLNAEFTHNSLCKTVNFYDETNGNVDTYLWDFGDGNTSTMQNPTHTYAANGIYTVCLIISDICGADSTCATVSVQDITPPTALCQNVTVQLDAYGNGTTTATLVDNGSSDACGIALLVLDNKDFTCSDVGSGNTVILTVTDENGNSSTCSSVVTVEDNVPPVAICQNVTVQLDAYGNGTTTATFVDNGSDDACGIALLVLDNKDFTCSDVGSENTVVLTVTDENGNSSTCSSVVTVKDHVPPVALCQDVTVQLDAYGNGTTTATLVDNGSNDACGIASIELDFTEFTCENLGENPVVLTVADVNGNTSTCGAIVKVEDNIPPVMVCNAMEFVLYENGEYVMNPRDIRTISEGTTDNCTSYEDLVITVFPRSFECVHIGEPVLVKVTATDASGNSASCQTTVTVYDETPPVAICKNITIELDENGEAYIFPGDINAGNDRASIPAWARTYNGIEKGSYDACGIDIIELDQYSFGCNELGENIVILTAVDESGNSSICSSLVTVVDNIVTDILPVSDMNIVVEPGVCKTSVLYPELVTHDNCEVTLFQTEGLGADGMFPLGITTETWTVTDKAGNSAEVSFLVEITTSNAPPTVNPINDIEVEEDTYGVIVPVTGISGGNDCVMQEVTVSLSSTNTELLSSITLNYTSGDSNATINLEFAPEISGESEITVTIVDSENETVSETFIVFVKAVNDPPFLVTPIVDQEVNASYKLMVEIDEKLGGMFDDIDDDMLTIKVKEQGSEVLPAWAIYNEGVLTIEPLIADTGCYNIVVQANDFAGAMVADTFKVCVLGYPVSIGELEQGSFEVKMYPNPTQGPVQIDFTEVQTEKVNLRVMNIAGQIVFQKEYHFTDAIRFDLHRNVSGMYMVIIETKDNQFIRKLILDRK